MGWLFQSLLSPPQVPVAASFSSAVFQESLLSHSIDKLSSYATPCGRRPILGVRLGCMGMQALERQCADLGCRLRRQQAVIAENDLSEINNSWIKRPAHLAETTIQAILDSITGDQGITRALDLLLPSILYVTA